MTFITKLYIILLTTSSRRCMPKVTNLLQLASVLEIHPPIGTALPQEVVHQAAHQLLVLMELAQLVLLARGLHSVTVALNTASAVRTVLTAELVASQPMELAQARHPRLRSRPLIVPKRVHQRNRLQRQVLRNL